ncbi:sonic hedgehog protein-like [Clavelina lepadiformis]|uniref:Hedgehog protein n=1 Tax=Clavelina lepadiformis TaxID=159417 RepID=A0ABP0FNP6_CLALP
MVDEEGLRFSSERFLNEISFIREEHFTDAMAAARDNVASKRSYSYERCYHSTRLCVCTCGRRSLEQNREPNSHKIHRKIASRSCIPMFTSCGGTSSLSSFRFCLYGFIIWTLIVGPMLSDMVRMSSAGRYWTTFGGVSLVRGCHPGPFQDGIPRHPRVVLTPFQRNEFVPKLSEETIGASGPAEGSITDSSQLKANYNSNIVFKDEEGTGEDRLMTARCFERLNILASFVSSEWPGVKLRVTEGWENPNTNPRQPPNSLHYEGRAVDITTNDEDLTKYPILARLAVEAGFDWVHFDNTYVHCSVKSDSSQAAQYGGCFPGDSTVPLPDGRSKKMSELRPGDQILSTDSSGRLISDSFLTFMDLQTDQRANGVARRAFVSIETEDGHRLNLTRNHLIYVSDVKGVSSDISSSHFVGVNDAWTPRHFTSPAAIFAGKASVGQYLHVTSNSTSTDVLRPSRIVKIDTVESASGAYAPLTNSGKIVVEGTLASCYAVIENDFVAHLAVTPLRYFRSFRNWMREFFHTSSLTSVDRDVTHSNMGRAQQEPGILPYAEFFYHVGSRLLPESLFWGD